MSGGEEGLKVNGLKEVLLMLKEEVEKAQSLLNSSHDKAIKVHVYKQLKNSVATLVLTPSLTLLL